MPAIDIRRRNQRALSRVDRVNADGSPTFVFDNAQILTLATEIFNLESNTPYGSQITKYLPLDFVEVINDQDEDIDVVLNGITVYRVLGRASRVILRRFGSIRVVNNSANTIAVDTIRLTMERLPMDADTEARQRARG